MEGSIKKRLLAMLVVVVMLLSTVMIFSTTMAETYLEVETQGKIPGVTVWAACSATTVGAGASANGSVLNTSTANLIPLCQISVQQADHYSDIHSIAVYEFSVKVM